jgi:hypothetical protein
MPRPHPQAPVQRDRRLLPEQQGPLPPPPDQHHGHIQVEVDVDHVHLGDLGQPTAGVQQQHDERGVPAGLES